MFDGKTYDPAFDVTRLGKQLGRVLMLMADGTWRTLAEIHTSIGLGTEAAISARLRDLRKDRFGGFVVERKRRGAVRAGLWEYRVLKPSATLPGYGGTGGGPTEACADAPAKMSSRRLGPPPIPHNWSE
jgi:hypothetical protein